VESSLNTATCTNAPRQSDSTDTIGDGAFSVWHVIGRYLSIGFCLAWPAGGLLEEHRSYTLSLFLNIVELLYHIHQSCSLSVSHHTQTLSSVRITMNSPQGCRVRSMPAPCGTRVKADDTQAKQVDTPTCWQNMHAGRHVYLLPIATRLLGLMPETGIRHVFRRAD
jgi:hypothetical protein